jgi:2-oxoglutarate ferredoxin oxidoreductase subunit gamma
MMRRTIFSGFGGQGVLLMGYVVANGAMFKGLNVTYLPAYGAEMRGGTANCTVTISDEEIASPVTSEPDILVAMNFPSLERFAGSVKPGGTIFVNASLVKEPWGREDVEEIRVPCLELAREAGSELAANMVMVGAWVEKTGILSLDDAIKGMAESMKGKERFFEQNRTAIQKGAQFIRSALH